MTINELIDILKGRKMVDYMGTIYDVISEYNGGVILQDVSSDYSTKISLATLFLHGSVYERGE